jgi:hypothetical protein
MTEIQARGEIHGLWTSLQAEYDRYKQAVTYIPTNELRLQEDLRRYLCLRCAGFLEQITYVTVSDFLTRKSSGPALEFATSFFYMAPNLGVAPFIRLIGRFGESYKQRFEEFLNPGRREVLSDLIGVRNDIAHGKYQAGRKLAPERYLILCKEIYDWYLGEFLEQAIVTVVVAQATLKA